MLTPIHKSLFNSSSFLMASCKYRRTILVFSLSRAAFDSKTSTANYSTTIPPRRVNPLRKSLEEPILETHHKNLATRFLYRRNHGNPSNFTPNNVPPSTRLLIIREAIKTKVITVWFPEAFLRLHKLQTDCNLAITKPIPRPIDPTSCTAIRDLLRSRSTYTSSSFREQTGP